jgi:hypothetical protein
MKKLLTLVFAFALFLTVSNAQTGPKFPNGGMETWISIPGFSPFPNGWLTYDFLTGQKTMEKSSDKHLGSFALGLTPDTTTALTPFPISIALAQMGALNIVQGDFTEGTAFAGRPSKLSIWIKRDVIVGKGGTDKDTVAMNLSLSLSKWDKTIKDYEEVGIINEDILIGTEYNKQYKELVIPIEYNLTSVPDTLRCTLFAAYDQEKRSPIRILLDDFGFVYTVGTKDLLANNIKVYPIPAMDYVILETEDLQNADRITLYNINGEVVIQQAIDDNKFRLSLDNVPNGMYLYQIRNKEGELLLGDKIEVVK